MEVFSYYDVMPYGHVASSSETSLCLYLSPHCYIPADIHLCSYCNDNLTPHKPYFVHHEEEAMFLYLLLLFMVVVVVVVLVRRRRMRGEGAVSEKFKEMLF